MTKQKKYCTTDGIMTEETGNNCQMDVRQILEWYITAGVDETCGLQPWDKAPEKAAAAVIPAVAVRQPVAQLASAGDGVRPATTELAQDTLTACQNARELSMKTETLDELRTLVEGFDGCALKMTANKTVFGYGSAEADLLLVGEAPGADEDRSGIPFVGRSGHLLDKMLRAIEIGRDECFVTNVLPWRPPGNRTPTSGEIAVCLPFLRRQIELVKPKVIMVLGGSAANALLDNGEPISRLRGKWLDYRLSDGTVIPVLASFHPAYLLRNGGQKAKAWSDLMRIKQKLCEN